MEAKVIIPIAVSCFALTISILAFYFSQLQPASLKVVAGEHVNIYYFPESNCAMSVPISVANNGARIAIVRRLALLVEGSDSTEGYLFEPIYYDRIDELGDFQHDSQPHPIPVPGRSTVTKQILFRSSLDRPDEFRYSKPGSYRVTVLAWLRNSVEPQAADTFSINISEKSVATLEERRDAKSMRSISVRQSEWRKWEAHTLREVEIAALTGKR